MKYKNIFLFFLSAFICFALFSQKKIDKNNPDFKSFGKSFKNYRKLLNNSEYNASIKEAEKTLEFGKKVYGEQGLPMVTIHSDIGFSYWMLADYEKALENYRKALDILNTRKKPEKLQALLATIYNNIGLVYKDIGDFKNALDYLKIAQSIWKNKLKDTAKEAIVYNNLGLIYQEMGLYKEAKNKFQEAMTIWKEISKENDTNAGKTYSNIGYIFYRKTLVY